MHSKKGLNFCMKRKNPQLTFLAAVNRNKICNVAFKSKKVAHPCQVGSKSKGITKEAFSFLTISIIISDYKTI